MISKKIIESRLKELEKLRDKYYMDYQQGGSASSMRTFEKYDDLCDICYAAMQGVSEEDEIRMHIRKNMTACVERFKDANRYGSGTMYTSDEVLDLLERMRSMA